MIEFHRLIMGDRVRNDAFALALQKSIVPGLTTVADIGSGTGFLGFLAANFGAKECHLYEYSPLLTLSKKIATLNAIKNCTFVHKHSTEVRTPAKVDLVVSETLGNFALEENILETLQDAKRFLRPGGTMIPQKLRQLVSPLCSDRLFKEITLWDAVGHGLNFQPAREASVNNIYVRTIKENELLPGAKKTWDEIDFREKNDSIRSSTVSWTFDDATNLYGFALWWDCELLPTIHLSTAPDAPATHWEQIYLPVPAVLSVPAGGTLRLHLHCDSRLEVKIHVKWEVEVLDANDKRIARYMMDMAKGMV